MTERVCGNTIALVFRASGVDDHTPQLCNATHSFIDGARSQRRPFSKPQLRRICAAALHPSTLSSCSSGMEHYFNRPALNTAV